MVVWSDLSGAQWGVVGATWLALWAIPGFLIRRHAVRAQNPTAHYWFWSTVLLLGPLGIFAYWQDRKVRARKGELYAGER